MQKKLEKKEFVELYKKHLIHKKAKKNREIRLYTAYRKHNYRKIISDYYNSKSRDK